MCKNSTQWGKILQQMCGIHGPIVIILILNYFWQPEKEKAASLGS